MKKFLVLVFFLLTLSCMWSQSLIFFSKITLDMKEDEVVDVLNTEFVGKFRIDKTGTYVVTIDSDKKLYITIYGEKIYT